MPLEDAATVAEQGAAAAPTLKVPGAIRPRRRQRLWILIAITLLGALGVFGGIAGRRNAWRDFGKGDVAGNAQDLPLGVSGKDDSEPPTPEKIKVPGVVGLTEQEARERLAETGFVMEVKRQESPEEGAGEVLGQSAPGGKEAEKGSKIVLTVGEAPEAARIPTLVGLSYPQAEDKLQEAGLLLGGVEEAPSDTAPAGVIIEQDPPPGTQLNPDSYVYLTTSVRPSSRSGAGGY